jgi:phosphoribosyl 1,2-cyclic phosphodiesterase
LRIGDGQSTLGVLTDVGSCTPHLLTHLEACDALLLECNHDAALLAQSRYPPSLKARIAGSHGHLSNALAAQILAECAHAGLRHVVAAHLSEQNNRPALAQRALADACGGAEHDIAIADPATGFGWLGLR